MFVVSVVEMNWLAIRFRKKIESKKERENLQTKPLSQLKGLNESDR